MLILTFRLLAGRYHATPWGAHVNEGLVEWPPSPWRVLRAMMAVGYSRLGWTDPPLAARSLLEKLAAAVPVVHLPPARAAHTRHYMPLYGNAPKANKETKVETTKVIDTFAHTGDAELAVAWDVALSEEELALAQEIARGMPYLGRAESWVECRVADSVPSGLAACVSGESCPGPGLERVALLAPEPPEAYAAWRSAAVERERATQLAKAVSKAEATGKRVPKALSARDSEKVETLFPRNTIEVLRLDTRWLRDQGWSQPPGTRWVSFWRPVDALRAEPMPPILRRRTSLPTTALLALASDTRNGEALPPMRDGLWRMEAIHDALVRISDRSTGSPSPVFTGNRGGEPLRGHVHASLVPLALGRSPTHMDHILVHAPMGFDEGARTALAALSRTWAKDLPTLYVTLVGMGKPDEFAKLVPHVRNASAWVTETPFVPPRHMKERGKDTLEGQVRAELASRGLPEPIRVDVLDRARDFRWFRRVRRDPSRRPPSPMGVALRVEFATEVTGPISLGYASHFGLGALVPSPSG